MERGLHFPSSVLRPPSSVLLPIAVVVVVVVKLHESPESRELVAGQPLRVRAVEV